MSLQEEIRQNRPFTSSKEEAFLSTMMTGELLRGVVESRLKPFGVTQAQYNILRILKGSLEEGRTCGEISERMISRDPDITRLIDNLLKKGLVRRERDHKDRRVVRSFIEQKGLQLLAEIEKNQGKDKPGLFEGLSEEKIQDLILSLEQIRNNIRRNVSLLQCSGKTTMSSQ